MATPEFQDIVLGIEGSIAELKLNRPKQHNAMTDRMRQEIWAALESLAKNDQVKVVLVKGEGKSFCSGADIKEVSGQKKSLEQMFEFNWAVQERARLMIKLGKPTIALLHGWVIAGGFEFSLNCDLRIAADDTRFWLSEHQFGSMYNNATYALLPQIVGLGRAKELSFLAQPIDANTAEKWGLVNKIVPLAELDKAGMEWAEQIAKYPALSIRLSRRLFDYAIDPSVERILDAEAFATTIAESSEVARSGLKERVKEI
jgi:enoyl-CoA hydratase/carnithine racemase